MDNLEHAEWLVIGGFIAGIGIGFITGNFIWGLAGGFVGLGLDFIFRGSKN